MLAAVPSPKFKRLDVRPILQEGREPFSEIRRRIDQLRENEGLAVIAPFLPSPLLEKLRNENFSTRVEPQADGSYIAYFWRDTPAAE